MKINSKLKKTIKVCGEKIHPGEHNYKKLSLKDKAQRFRLLSMRDAKMIDFNSDEKIDYEDDKKSLPFYKSKEEKEKEAKEKKAKQLKEMGEETERRRSEKKKRKGASDVPRDEEAAPGAGTDGNQDSSEGRLPRKKKKN